MIIGVLGKGGSGKSTVATMLVQHLHQAGNTVLAIDADHNMDLAFNLGYTGDGPYIGGSFLQLRNTVGLNDTEPTENLFVKEIPEPRFLFTKPDWYSQEYVHQLKSNLYLMMSGPQNEQVLYGAHCSHSLAAPLKIYLPLLELATNEMVVVDEKASVDAVSTGIPTGFDVAVVVVEPRIHSVRAGKQIIDTLRWYGVPHVLVLNKQQRDDDGIFVEKVCGELPSVMFPEIPDSLSEHQNAPENCARLVHEAQQRIVGGSSRLSRTIEKYKRNAAWQTTAR